MATITRKQANHMETLEAAARLALSQKETLSEESRKAIAAKLYEDLEGLMGNLASRWSMESQFEDIKDYQKVLAPKVEAVGGKITKMTKRPFGFEYELGGCTYKMSMSTNGQYSYKRTK